jgi:putative protease
MSNGKKVGVVTHYFDKIGVAIVNVKGTIAVGDQIEIRDKTGEEVKFNQEVSSMQVEHENINKAKKGQEIGLKVDQGVKEKDLIYKV